MEEKVRNVLRRLVGWRRGGTWDASGVVGELGTESDIIALEGPEKKSPMNHVINSLTE